MIQLDNIYKNFPNKNVLNGVSFTIQEKQITCLLGKNGAGKSTLINIISGIIKPINGSIVIDGTKITFSSFNYHKKFGYLFEKPMLIDKYSGKEYLSLIAEMYGLSSVVYKERINSLMSFFNIPDSNKFIEAYSLGMKTKLAIASALIHKPKYLILDEPFNSLDIESIDKLERMMKSFVKQNKAIFITSHSLDLIANLCDRFLIMDKGKIVMDIQKTDYPNIEGLKNAIKEKITDNSNFQDLSWLT